MSETLVLQPLQKAVIAAVAASTLPELPVKFMGRVVDVPNDQKYLEVVHIPNNPNNVSWGNEKQFRGLLRLILHWPINNEGVYAPNDLIASIAGYFRKDQVLWHNANHVNVTENPVSSGMITNTNELLFIYTIEYSSHRP